MTKQEQFFYNNAGYSINTSAGETPEQGKIRGAVRLAAAETWAAQQGYTFSFQSDPEGCIGCDCGSNDCACENGTCNPEVCTMFDADDRYVQSLGSICGATPEYRRVIRAELALEEMATHKLA